MSFVENFKDRVPTQILSNGAIRYEQFDANGNSLGYVYYKRADEPSEEGNIWNKAIYDGIKSSYNELNTNKLNVSNKATQAEAEAGTDNTKYMTPIRTQQHYNNKKATQSEARSGTNDTKYMTPLKVKDVLSQKLTTRSYNISISTSASSTINLNNYINSNTILIEFEFNIGEFYFDSSNVRWQFDSENGAIEYVQGETSAQRINRNLVLDQNKNDAYAKLSINPHNRFFDIISVGGLTELNRIWGFYDSIIPQIEFRRVESVSTSDYIKIKAYDSAEITNL